MKVIAIWHLAMDFKDQASAIVLLVRGYGLEQEEALDLVLGRLRSLLSSGNSAPSKEEFPLATSQELEILEDLDLF